MSKEVSKQTIYIEPESTNESRRIHSAGARTGQKKRKICEQI